MKLVLRDVPEVTIEQEARRWWWRRPRYSVTVTVRSSSGMHRFTASSMNRDDLELR